MATNQRPRPASAALAVAVLAGVAFLAGCTGTGSSAAPPPATSPAALSPAALYRAALAALRSGGSVHIDIAASTPDGSEAFSDDATASGGRQIITVDQAGHATILLIDGVDYVQGNALGLEGLFQLSPDLAAQAANRWIELRPGDKLGLSTYDDVTEGITLSSVATEMTLSGTLTAVKPTTVSGQPVDGVEAPAPASEGMPAGARNVLYVADNSLHRPVVFEVQGAGDDTNQMSFSQWGEKVRLTAPANAIPASEITPSTSLV